MMPMNLVEPIAKWICKIMKLSVHLCEFILPKEEYVEDSSSIHPSNPSSCGRGSIPAVVPDAVTYPAHRRGSWLGIQVTGLQPAAWQDLVAHWPLGHPCHQHPARPPPPRALPLLPTSLKSLPLAFPSFPSPPRRCILAALLFSSLAPPASISPATHLIPSSLLRRLHPSLPLIKRCPVAFASHRQLPPRVSRVCIVSFLAPRARETVLNFSLLFSKISAGV